MSGVCSTVKALWHVTAHDADALLTLCGTAVAGSEAVLGPALEDAGAKAEARRRFSSKDCGVASELVRTRAYSENLPAVRRELCAVLLREPVPDAVRCDAQHVLSAGLGDSWSATRKASAAAVPRVFGNAGDLLPTLHNGIRSADWQVADGCMLALKAVLSATPHCLPLLPWCQVPQCCRLDVELCDEAAAAAHPHTARPAAPPRVAEPLVADILACLGHMQDSVADAAAAVLCSLAAHTPYMAQVPFFRRILLAVCRGSEAAFPVMSAGLRYLPRRFARAGANAALVALGDRSSIARQLAASLLADCVACWPDIAEGIVGGMLDALPDATWQFREGAASAFEDLAVQRLIPVCLRSPVAQCVAGLDGSPEVLCTRAQALPHVARLALCGGAPPGSAGDELAFWLVWGSRVLRIAAPPAARAPRQGGGHWAAYTQLALAAYAGVPLGVPLGGVLSATRSDPHAAEVLARMLPDVVVACPGEVGPLVQHTCVLVAAARDVYITSSLLEVLRRCALLLSASAGSQATLRLEETKVQVLTCLTESQYRAWADADAVHAAVEVEVPRIAELSPSLNLIMRVCCQLLTVVWTEAVLCKAALAVLRHIEGSGNHILRSVLTRMEAEGFVFKEGMPTPVGDIKQLSDWDLDSEDDDDAPAASTTAPAAGFIGKWRAELADCLLTVGCEPSELYVWCTSADTS